MLLHVCCAACACSCIEQLRRDCREPDLCFSNSNIFPETEFERRRQSVRSIAERFNLALWEDAYNHDAWLATVAGLEAEPEGGNRCRACFEWNLDRVSELARSAGYAAFTTTLTVSPHKDSREVFAAGDRRDNFLAMDFKKKNGYLRSVQLSRELEVYRQDYCGCEFSIRRR